MTTLVLILLLLALFLGLCVFLYFVSTQRQLVRLDENCKNALGQIEVQLNSRWDALLALAKTATKYAAHESETLINTISQRRQGGIRTAEDVKRQEGELSSLLGRLMAVGEAYPNLKADQLYLDTMAGVKQYEENVRLSRMTYNDTATLMNRTVRQWPSSIVASMLHFTERDYLTTDDAAKNAMPELFE